VLCHRPTEAIVSCWGGGEKGARPAQGVGCGATGSSFLGFTDASQTQLLAAPERGWARRRWGPFLLEGWIEGAPPRGFPDDWPAAMREEQAWSSPAGHPAVWKALVPPQALELNPLCGLIRTLACPTPFLLHTSGAGLFSSGSCPRAYL
jgi:hypothetical protein